MKENYNADTEKRKEYQRKAYARRIKCPEYREKQRTKWRLQKRKQRQHDPAFKLKDNICRRIRHALKARGATKTQRTMGLVGCSMITLQRHLETLFLPGMNWDNQGAAWHVDHIVPLHAFDLSDHTQLRIANWYRNLQPLWARDNLRKSAKYTTADHENLIRDFYDAHTSGTHDSEDSVMTPMPTYVP